MILSLDKDRRFTRAFLFLDRNRTGYLNAENLIEALRLAGAAPTAAQIRELPQSATLTDIRGIIKTCPSSLGFIDSSRQSTEMARLGKLLDKYKTGFISPMELTEVLQAGGSSFSLPDISELIKDPRKTFTHPRTGELDIERFLRTLQWILWGFLFRKWLKRISDSKRVVVLV